MGTNPYWAALSRQRAADLAEGRALGRTKPPREGKPHPEENFALSAQKPDLPLVLLPPCGAGQSGRIHERLFMLPVIMPHVTELVKHYLSPGFQVTTRAELATQGKIPPPGPNRRLSRPATWPPFRPGPCTATINRQKRRCQCAFSSPRISKALPA